MKYLSEWTTLTTFKGTNVMRRIKVRVLENKKLHARIYRLRLLPEVDIPLQPGQFFMIHIKNSSGRFLFGRPFSICNWWELGWEIMYQIIGYGTQSLSKKKPGDILTIYGPMGKPYPPPPQEKTILLLSGGVGIASLYPYHRFYATQGYDIIHIYGARSRDHLVYAQHLEHLPGTTYIVTDDGSSGRKGTVLDLLKEIFPAIHDKLGMIIQCGPLPMMKALACYIREQNFSIPFFSSMEIRMACGYGVCRGCAVPLAGNKRKKYAMVCVDGPALPSHHIQWENVIV